MIFSNFLAGWRTPKPAPEPLLSIPEWAATPYEPVVKLVWATPNGEQLVADMARVSNPDGEGKPYAALLRYLVEHKHWSPFEMVNMCVEVHVPRDISRQILRHRSLSFQEMSGRYAAYNPNAFMRETRMQHPTNRQMSVPCNDRTVDTWFKSAQAQAQTTMQSLYQEALTRGIAKEQARVLLPEGLTMSRLYINGSVRSWIHYLNIRTDVDAVQREHVHVADAIKAVFVEQFPTLSTLIDR